MLTEYGFWDIFSGLFGVFVFVAYLVVLFTIIADLFRDTELNGWAKAVWLIFLVFVPFLTALVYVIARGKQLAARQRERRAIANEYVDDRGGVSTYNPNDEIAKAQGLLRDGTISQAEYDRIQADTYSQ
ncbi:PLDc N-terminal domain-containing protein [Agromyces sp. SYSU K20354]|uniref:PLDc N-terminal domain-containing protein n=1 Tax=Agromyces cavernae TaxID=2898659 RepID=UPI001E39527C|nr:PLDc N-terminal domain-containing protein [Agromyces cavernae]MCD2440850.1 PLDc N-terminal domain-containing protein [Agromyces cavernae]